MATRDQRKIVFYRRQAQALHVHRQRHSGRARPSNFLALLSESDGVYCWDVYEAPDLCLCSDDCKDTAVDRIRNLCRPESPDEGRMVAVWFATEGWIAPPGKVMPRRHPKRKHGLLLFESTAIADRFGFLDDRAADGRWSWDLFVGDGRFANLIGRALTKPELRVVHSTIH